VGSKTIHYKEWLNPLEREWPSCNSISAFYKRKKNKLLAQFQEQVTLKACEPCSQPTSAPGLCAFCRLWDRVAQAQASEPATTGQLSGLKNT
jgi:tRNA-5-methyluridine54 2-sulfurtransferase